MKQVFLSVLFISLGCSLAFAENSRAENSGITIKETKGINQRGKVISNTISKGTNVIQFLEYFESGKLKSDYYYGEEGKLGYYKTYYESGELKSEVAVVNRHPNGEEKSYRPDGSLESVVNRKREKKFSSTFQPAQSREYYGSGKLKSETFYDENGSGYTRTYHENGQLKTEVPIVNRHWHGQERYFKADGTPEYSIEYQNGMPKGYKSPGTPDPRTSPCTSRC